MSKTIRSWLLGLCMLASGALFASSTAGAILSWQPNPPADSVESYSVFRSIDLGLSIETYWWGITDSFYVDESTGTDRLYTYWVKAYNKHGSSPPSDQVSYWHSSNTSSVSSGELRLLTELKGDSLEVRWSIEEAISSMIQYDRVDGVFESGTRIIEGPGPYTVMIPVTDTLRAVCWSGERGEDLSVYALIPVSPPSAPEVEITPFR